MKKLATLMVIAISSLILIASCGPLKEHSKTSGNKSAKGNHENHHQH